MSIVKPQLICPYLGWLIAFQCVRDVTTEQRLRQQQEVNFSEGTVLTRFTTTVIIILEIWRLLL